MKTFIKVGLVSALAIIWFVLPSGDPSAQVYKWVDEKGVVHISDSPVQTGNEMNKIERMSGTGKESSASSAAKTVLGEWYPKSESLERASLLASEYLTHDQNWPEKPVFYRGDITTLVSSNIKLEYVFGFSIPAVMLDSRCAFGIQRVHVKMKFHEEDKSLISFKGVQLSDKVLVPHRCDE